MRKKKLSSICKVSNGFAFKSKDYTDDGYRVIRITNVQKGFVVDNNPKFVPQEIADRAGAFKLVSGDILVSLTGNVGRVGRIQSQHLPAVVNQRVGLIRPLTDEINDKYLFQYLNSNKFEHEAIQNSNGVAQLNLSSKWIENYEISLPLFKDQIRIAHLLEKTESLITERKQHLKQLDKLLKSIFLEMFSPSCQYYDDWPLVEIRDLAAKHKRAMRTGPFGSNLLHSEFTSDGDVAVLGIDNAVQNRFAWGEYRYISNEKYQELENYRIYPGDVIITIMGTIGRSAVVPDDIPIAINTKHLAAITVNRSIANPLFLSYSIHSSPFILNQFKSKTRGAIMNGLNLGLIKETKLKQPPIELQNKFAEIHIRIDELKNVYQISLLELDTLYNALSQQAFKGELDLSRIKPPTQRIIVSATEDLSAVSTATTIKQLPTINLSNPNCPAEELYAKDGLRKLIIKWLESYRIQLANEAFSIERFMTAVQNRLMELYPDNEFEMDANKYEYIKEWVFLELEAGRLEQSRNVNSNMIELRAVQS